MSGANWVEEKITASDFKPDFIIKMVREKMFKDIIHMNLGNKAVW